MATAKIAITVTGRQATALDYISKTLRQIKKAEEGIATAQNILRPSLDLELFNGLGTNPHLRTVVVTSDSPKPLTVEVVYQDVLLVPSSVSAAELNAFKVSAQEEQTMVSKTKTASVLARAEAVLRAEFGDLYDDLFETTTKVKAYNALQAMADSGVRAKVLGLCSIKAPSYRVVD